MCGLLLLQAMRPGSSGGTQPRGSERASTERALGRQPKRDWVQQWSEPVHAAQMPEVDECKRKHGQEPASAQPGSAIHGPPVPSTCRSHRHRLSAEWGPYLATGHVAKGKLREDGVADSAAFDVLAGDRAAGRCLLNTAAPSGLGPVPIPPHNLPLLCL